VTTDAVDQPLDAGGPVGTLSVGSTARLPKLPT